MAEQDLPAELLKAYSDASVDELVRLIYAYTNSDTSDNRRNVKLTIGFAEPSEPSNGPALIRALAYDTQRGTEKGQICAGNAKRTERGALRSLLCESAKARLEHLAADARGVRRGSTLDQPLDTDRMCLLPLPAWEANERELRYQGKLVAHLLQALPRGEIQEILEKLEASNIHKDHRPYLEINAYPDIPTPGGAQAYRYVIISRAGLQADIIPSKDTDPVTAPRKQHKGITLRGPYSPTLVEAWRAWKAEYNRVQGTGQYGAVEDQAGVLARRKAVQGASADAPEVIWDRFVVREFPQYLNEWH